MSLQFVQDTAPDDVVGKADDLGLCLWSKTAFKDAYICIDTETFCNIIAEFLDSKNPVLEMKTEDFKLMIAFGPLDIFSLIIYFFTNANLQENDPRIPLAKKSTCHPSKRHILKWLNSLTQVPGWPQIPHKKSKRFLPAESLATLYATAAQGSLNINAN